MPPRPKGDFVLSIIHSDGSWGYTLQQLLAIQAANTSVITPPSSGGAHGQGSPGSYNVPPLFDTSANTSAGNTGNSQWDSLWMAYNNKLDIQIRGLIEAPIPASLQNSTSGTVGSPSFASNQPHNIFLS